MSQVWFFFKKSRQKGAVALHSQFIYPSLLLFFLSGCFGDKQEYPSSGAPVGISYSANPAYYTLKTEIEPNQAKAYGSPTENFSVSPSLPPGLKMDSATGEITGTPLVIVPLSEYIVRATNKHGSGMVRLKIGVGDFPPTITYAGEKTLIYDRGVAITKISPVLGGGRTLSCVANPELPAGLALSSQCEISGTPTAGSKATAYSVTAQNSGGSASLEFNFTVIDWDPSFTYSSTTFNLSRDIAMSARSPVLADESGVIVSCSSTPNLPAGLALSSDCTISGTPTELVSGNYTITGLNINDIPGQREVSINVTDLPTSIRYATSTWSFTNGVALGSAISVTNSGGRIVDCSVSPDLPSGLVLHPETCAITGQPTAVAAAANYTVTASNTEAPDSTAVLNIEVKDTPPSIAFSADSYSLTNRSTITSSIGVATISPTNSGGNIVSCAISPALSNGLSFDTSTCVISGTPTIARAATSYTVTATNTGGSSAKTISITVAEAAPVITFATDSQTFVRNTAITDWASTNTGGSVTSCTASPTLPSGLSVGVQSIGGFGVCVITGTPTLTYASATYTITGTNSAGSGSDDVTIIVNPAVPVLSYTGSPFTYTKDIQIASVTPTNTGDAVTSCSVNPALPTGLTLSTACVISGTPTVTVYPATTYTITPSNDGGNGADVQIDIRVNDPTPTVVYAASSFDLTEDTAATLVAVVTNISTCTISPALPAGLSITSGDCSITGTPSTYTANTAYVVTATNSTANSVTTNLSIRVRAEAPIITFATTNHSLTKDLAGGLPITPVSSGGAIGNCTVDRTLPTGLSLNTSTCEISGTPTVVSTEKTYVITAHSADGVLTDSESLNITVIDSAPSFSYAPASYTYTINSAIATVTPTLAGGSGSIVSCSANDGIGGGLPAGLSLSSGCVITGTPTVVTAQKTYTISGTNTGGAGTTGVTITVNDLPPTLSYGVTVHTLTVDSVFSLAAVTGGGTITSCTVVDSVSGLAKSLPTGLSISNTTCNLSGTPTAITASDTYRVKASNSGGDVTVDLTITVNDKAPSISYLASPFTWTQGTSIGSITVTNAGGAGTPTSCNSAPALPAGISLSANCTLSGTPAGTQGATAYVITAGNSSGSTSDANISITINAKTPVFSFSPSSVTYTKDSVIAAATPTQDLVTGGALASCSVNPALPAGLNLNGVNCEVTGTPSVVSAQAVYTFTGTNSTGQSSTTTLTITVNDIAPTISYVPLNTELVYTRNSVIAAVNPTLGGGTVTSCTVSPALPAGLSLHATTCSLTGIPTGISTRAAYTITVSNSGGSVTDTLYITVNAIAPVISYSSNNLSLTVRTAFTAPTLTNTGDAATSCEVLVAGVASSLPSGLALSSTCEISGTPLAVTSSTIFQIKATNTGGVSTYNITIQVKPRPAIVFSSLHAISGAVNGTPTTSSNIWKVANDGGDLVTLTSNTAANLGSVDPSFSADGLSVVYASLRALAGTTNGATSSSYNAWTSLVASPFTGTKRTENSMAGFDVLGTVQSHPSGGKILFSAKQDLSKTASGSSNGTANDCYNIWEVDLTSGARTAITQNTGVACAESKEPVYSPNGAYIYFSSTMDTAAAGTPATWNQPAEASYNIWRYTVATSAMLSITSETAAGKDSFEPQVSYDSQYIVFSSLKNTSGASASRNIWRAEANGANAVYLTDNTLASLDSISPRLTQSSNSYITYASLQDVAGVPSGSYNIWKMELNGANNGAVTTNTAPNKDSLQPHFSNDDSQIAFESKQNVGGGASSSYNIWVYTISGASQSAVTTNTNAGLDSTLSSGKIWFTE